MKIRMIEEAKMPEEGITAEEAIRRMKDMEEQAKKIGSTKIDIGGWRLTKKTDTAYWYTNDAGEIVSVPK